MYELWRVGQGLAQQVGWRLATPLYTYPLLGHACCTEDEPEPLFKFRDGITWKDSLFIIFLMFVIAFVSIKAIDWIVTYQSEKVARHNRLRIKQIQPFLRRLVTITVVVVLINLFVEISDENVWAVTASVALALGFAFKDYASSVIAGMIGLLETPYRVGDRIEIAGHYGEVTSYGLRSVRLQTPDDNMITVPHSHIWHSAVSNANGGELEAQVVTEFYLAHEVDPEQVENILYRVAYTSKFTQLELPIRVVMAERSWGSLFKLRSYPIDARDEFAYKTDLTIRAKKAFAKRNLPYPKRFDPENPD